MNTLARSSGLLCAGLLFTTALSLADIESKQLEFDVLLDGNSIGTHRYELRRQGETLWVDSRADFSVKILFIEAWSYSHRNREVWKGDCLERLDSKTVTNGRTEVVEARRNDNGLLVDSGGERNESLPGCVMSFAYWNTDFLESERLLNAQTGELVDVTVDELGQERMQDGERVATRYRLKGEDLSLDLWYGEDKEWLGLRSKTVEGKVLDYVRR